MPSIVFIYVGELKLCLDSIGVGFYIIFGVTLIDRNMCQWNNCCGGNISRISLLFSGSVCLLGLRSAYIVFWCSIELVVRYCGHMC